MISKDPLKMLVFSLVAVFLVVLVGGCAPTVSTDPLEKQVAGTPSDQVPLIPQKITVVSDLPVPARMKIKESISHSYEGAGGRTVNYTYEGWVDMRRVHRFYLDQMPLSNWQLLANNYDRGVYSLTFQKGAETCTVRIHKSLITSTVVQLLIQRPQVSR